MAKNVAKNVVMVFEDKTFFNEKDGQVVDYVDITATINGEAIGLKVKPADKSLLRVLRKSMQVVEG